MSKTFRTSDFYRSQGAHHERASCDTSNTALVCPPEFEACDKLRTNRTRHMRSAGGFDWFGSVSPAAPQTVKERSARGTRYPKSFSGFGSHADLKPCGKRPNRNGSKRFRTHAHSTQADALRKVSPLHQGEEHFQ
jgi:hypothetical protein